MIFVFASAGPPTHSKWRGGAAAGIRRHAPGALRLALWPVLALAFASHAILSLRRLSSSSPEEAFVAPWPSSGGISSEERAGAAASAGMANVGGGTVADLAAADDGLCSVYLAPSSVADGNDRPAGFGIFTTRAMTEGEYIFRRGSGPVVPIADYKVNNGGRSPSYANSIFMPRCLGMGIEGDQPGRGPYPNYKTCYKSNNNVGSLTNFHPALTNVIADDADEYRDNILSRYADPGAGAFSYHFGERWRVTRHVEAGEELFNGYGEDWFLGKVLRGKDDIPHKKHYGEAAEIIDRFVDLHGEESIGEKQLDAFREEVARADDVGHLTKRLVDLSAPDVGAFSRLIESAREYAGASEGEHSRRWRLARSIGLRSTLHPDGPDVDWIRENGRCLDNIYPGRSTVPQAGRGAFAARRLEKGDVVVPLPTIVQVTDRDSLLMYKHEYVNSKMKSVGDPYTKQLLVNYCFGHDDSPMLLCPATNANLINHCGARSGERAGSCDPEKGPNAVVRWATGFDPETSEWLAQDLRTIDERIRDGRRGLSLEVVALRAIDADEEVFIDYGPSWEDAWNAHVSSWRPPHDDAPFVPVSDMNRDVGRHLLTKAELDGGASYPHRDVRVGCRVGGHHHPCEVLERIDDAGLRYAVRIRAWTHEGESYEDFDYDWPFARPRATGNVSVSAIRFFAGPYAGDQYLEGAFRHHIGVPEGMWPERWLDSTVAV